VLNPSARSDKRKNQVKIVTGYSSEKGHEGIRQGKPDEKYSHRTANLYIHTDTNNEQSEGGGSPGILKNGSSQRNLKSNNTSAVATGGHNITKTKQGERKITTDYQEEEPASSQNEHDELLEPNQPIEVEGLEPDDVLPKTPILETQEEYWR